MRSRRLVPAALLAVLAGCGDSITSSVDEVVLESDFQSGSTAGWVVEFADYPAGDEEIYDLQSGIRPLPAPLDTSRRGLFVSGSNRSDDLFMYLKRPVDGLTPGATYRVRFEVEIATREGSGCVGIGGAPGESVFLKAGATTREPTRVKESDGWYRLSVDKGNQASPGASVAVIGDLANGSDQCSGGDFRLKRLEDPANTVRAAADASGRLWLLIGTDSGYEGITSLYYTRIRAVIEKE